MGLDIRLPIGAFFALIGLMLSEVREAAKSVRSPPTLGRMFIVAYRQTGTLMAHQHPPRFLKIVDDAKKRVRETNVDTVKTRMDRGEKVLLIDVREESEYAKDHLPGAIHLGKGIIERDIEARVPELNTEMILYCGGGFRSAHRAVRSVADVAPRSAQAPRPARPPKCRAQCAAPAAGRRRAQCW